MFIIAFLLAVAAAIFSAAGANSSGWAIQVCQYGGVFCMNPSWLIMAAACAAVWGGFMRVDRL